jgi:hypothetical protein
VEWLRWKLDACFSDVCYDTRGKVRRMESSGLRNSFFTFISFDSWVTSLLKE